MSRSTGFTTLHIVLLSLLQLPAIFTTGSACAKPLPDGNTPSQGDKPVLWVVERDCPGARNLVPVLNRTTVLACLDGNGTSCTLTLRPPAGCSPKSEFWPKFGSDALLPVPMRVPEALLGVEPRELGAPTRMDGGGAFHWGPFRLGPDGDRAVTARSLTYLGPPDLYHTEDGLAFGPIAVRTRLAACGNLTIVFHAFVENVSDEAVRDFEMAWFFPRALLDEETGGEKPLYENGNIDISGFSDEALPLMVCDGIARPALGWRCSWRLSCFEAHGSHDLFVVIRARNARRGIFLPIVTVNFETAMRFFPSSEIVSSASVRTRFSDYTYFNLVTPASRMLRLSSGPVVSERSSSLVRSRLAVGVGARPVCDESGTRHDDRGGAGRRETKVEGVE